ncbi:MAG: bifunctional 5,10-methylene-tetrahydrofolate dehydrogenase/5,10-methylene-tetrahydrofolate cyclohydrolase, partial [Spirochaetales bacterium]|nr:bifunctional 5,10-methylene-tetrahydrofolate dehydrogenase/5,10-methylene-tetrahydrofolate cyclohydrolase [Spirochaetales bacterium]
NNKKKACDEVGILHRDYAFDSSLTQEELLECIYNLNCDPCVDGILVQMPLPPQVDELAVTEAIAPEKDVDGFHPKNIGRILLGQKALVACTPKGILKLLDYYRIDVSGKNVCIVGRSNIVGKPLAALLMQKGRDATVTVCNSKTRDLSFFTRNADIVVMAAGRVGLLKSDMVKSGAVVIDVGINRVPDISKKSGYSLRGDADYDSLTDVVSAITPVPGGVGPMTIAMLMENTLYAACWREEIEPEELG